MTRRILSSFAVLAAAGAVVAGCGSSNDSSGSTSASGGGGNGYGAGSSTPAKTTAAASGDLKLKAVEANGLSFDQKTLNAKAGTVTITMDNPSGDSQMHAIAVEGNGVDKDGKVVQPGGTSTVSLDLKPGKYTFYCPVPGHRQAGMEGTLTVQ